MTVKAQQEQQSTSLHETARIAKELSAQLCKGDVVTLQGTLGSGKTAFCRFLIEELLGKEFLGSEVTSPTFGLMNQYSNDHMTICHFDLYRLSSFEDFAQRGFLDYLHDENTVCLVEWPEQIMNVVDPKNTWNCFIEMSSLDMRIFKINKSL